MKTSIIIVTYNEEKNIKECLDSLMNQVKKPDEMILADDGSTDKTLEIASRYPIKTIKLNHGERSSARNIGWRKATGDLIIFAEADSMFNENWILEIYKKFESGADAVIDRRKMYKPKTFLQKCFDAQFDIRYKNYKPFSAWGFKRYLLREMNGFDEKLNQSEDRDLGKRLLKRGCKILLAEKAIQYHKGEPQNIFQYLKRAYVSENRRVGGYYKKYPEEIPIKKIIGFVIFFILLLFAFANLNCLLILVFFIIFCGVVIFYKIAFIEKGWNIANKKYLLGLTLYRMLRNIFSAIGFLSGRVFEIKN